MNSNRINDNMNETQTQQTDEENRSTNSSYHNNLIYDDGDDNDNDNENDTDTYMENDDDDDEDRPGPFSLDKVLNRFGNNVELLELILTSKVEEDRRLTEEAKLKIKQLDYEKDKKKKKQLSDPSPQLPRLCNYSSFSTDSLLTSSDNDSTFIRKPSFLHHAHHYTPELKNNYLSDSSERRTSPPLSRNRPLPSIEIPPDDHIKKSPHFFTAPSLSATSPSPSAPIPLTLTYSNHHRHHRQPSSSSFPFFSTSKPLPAPASPLHQPDTPSPPMLPSHATTIIHNKLPIPQITSNHHHQHHENSGHESLRKKPMKRRRREMQSITMIIETKEYPYNDNYSWKNNGNTVHKKSGQRSIYYKCSNAAKGCHVNKTVTCKGQDEYLIKYRGKHLQACSISNSDPTSISSQISLSESSTAS